MCVVVVGFLVGFFLVLLWCQISLFNNTLLLCFAVLHRISKCFTSIKLLSLAAFVQSGKTFFILEAGEEKYQPTLCAMKTQHIGSRDELNILAQNLTIQQHSILPTKKQWSTGQGLMKCNGARLIHHSILCEKHYNQMKNYHPIWQTELEKEDTEEVFLKFQLWFFSSWGVLALKVKPLLTTLYSYLHCNPIH